MQGITITNTNHLYSQEIETKNPGRVVNSYTQTDHTQFAIRSQRIPLSKDTIPYPDQGGVVRLTTLELSNEVSFLTKKEKCIINLHQ